MPFALNEATRFISPTKTPEYLAAGKPVVSTPIADVVRDYGDRGLVRDRRHAAEFVAALEAAWPTRDARQPGSARSTASSRRCRGIGPGPRWRSCWHDGPRATQTGTAPASGAVRPMRRSAARSGQSRRSGFDYLIVGAGFAGSVLAERLAAARASACC